MRARHKANRCWARERFTSSGETPACVAHHSISACARRSADSTSGSNTSADASPTHRVHAAAGMAPPGACVSVLTPTHASPTLSDQARPDPTTPDPTIPAPAMPPPAAALACAVRVAILKTRAARAEALAAGAARAATPRASRTAAANSFGSELALDEADETGEEGAAGAAGARRAGRCGEPGPRVAPSHRPAILGSTSK
eukprot:scaffold22386_cov118-Isochrysis_galbana.AAC.3